MTYIKIKDVKSLKRGDLAKFRFPNGTRIDGFVDAPLNPLGLVEVKVGPATLSLEPGYFVSARQNVVVDVKFRAGERVELHLPPARPSRGTVIAPQSIASKMFNAQPNLVMVNWDEASSDGRRIASVPESMLRSIEGEE